MAAGLARQQPEKIAAVLDRIERETQRLDSLVGEVLTLSRLEAGVSGATDRQVEIAELLATVVDNTADRGGYGLGLAIARRAVETYGGSIRATNRPEGGLCVALTLPRATG